MARFNEQEIRERAEEKKSELARERASLIERFGEDLGKAIFVYFHYEDGPKYYSKTQEERRETGINARKGVVKKIAETFRSGSLELGIEAMLTIMDTEIAPVAREASRAASHNAVY